MSRVIKGAEQWSAAKEALSSSAWHAQEAQGRRGNTSTTCHQASLQPPAQRSLRQGQQSALLLASQHQLPPLARAGSALLGTRMLAAKCAAPDPHQLLGAQGASKPS